MVWPVQGMSVVIRSIVWAVPVQPAVESFRSILDRNWDLYHPSVYKGFVSNIIWTGIFLFVAFSVAKVKKIGV